MIRRQIPAPISAGSPYIPVMTYTMACPMVMIIPNTDKKGVHAYNQRQKPTKPKNYRKHFSQNHPQIWKITLYYCSRFWAPLNRALSLGVSPTSMILAPANNCMIKPDVTIGEIPNSINVPIKEENE